MIVVAGDVHGWTVRVLTSCHGYGMDERSTTTAHLKENCCAHVFRQLRSEPVVSVQIRGYATLVGGVDNLLYWCEAWGSYGELVA
jgi:hypothetical protein